MKEKVLLIFFLCNVALFVSAQSHMEKGLQSISRSSTEAIWLVMNCKGVRRGFTVRV